MEVERAGEYYPEGKGQEGQNERPCRPGADERVAAIV